MSWVPLHVHSQYSILDATASVKGIVKKAVSYEIRALALTDSGNLYGAVEFFKECKGAGIKPIIGCELAVAPGSYLEKKRIPGLPAGFPIVLLAKNEEGYHNLCKLSSIAHIEGFYYVPRIDKELLQKHAGGLVCLTGPLRGPLAFYAGQDKKEEFEKELHFYKELFPGDLYMELTRHEMEPTSIQKDAMEKETWLYQSYCDLIQQQKRVEKILLSASCEYEIPYVATNDSRYLERDDWKAQEILLNIGSGEPREIWERDALGNPKQKILNPKRKVKFSHELYFKSPKQMKERFADLPKALSNTLDVASKCNFSFDFSRKYYPVYVPPELEGKSVTNSEREKAAQDYLVKLCHEAIPSRYTEEALAKVQEQYPDQDPLDVVKDRLQTELDIILPKGMCDYLLIVYDFIHWAKSCHIPVGPGRGSGAGSIILYLIGITDIEPLRFNLFFERFINPERLSYPDIDVDICMERRQEVIDYTLNKYGKDCVAQIITFGKMKAKMAIKDVGRVLSVPLSRVNAITKLVPDDLGITIEKALEIDPDLKRFYETDEEVKNLIDIAKGVEGSVRNTGIHAAGLIISGDPLMQRIPISKAKDSEIAVTQYSMKPVEAAGMLKIDFLGLKTLTAIQVAVDAIERRFGRKIDPATLPLDDEKTFELLNHGKTMGIFQLESAGMQDLAKQLHLDKFEEIIAVGALYRPGPMEMIPSFIERKHGREEIEIDHPLMESVLKETYGIMVYQEQVMQIASLLAGYSLGEGDVLRRAMGKKDREEMARQRKKFREGAIKRGVDDEVATTVFNKIEKFASYGFNKSHAAAYGYLSYVTAYLKAHFPGEWMAALMTTDREDISKVAKFIREAQAMGIAMLPPDINESGTKFLATQNGIRFALSGIKGVGSGVVDTILKEREKNGPFHSLFHFFERIDTKKVGKKVAEMLIEAGAFDFTGWTRQEMLLSVEPMFQEASAKQTEEAKGYLSLFSLTDEDQSAHHKAPPKVDALVPKLSILRRENELLGFYVTGHPLNEYRDLMPRLSCVPFDELSRLDDGALFRAVFIIESVKTRVSARSQRKFAILQVGDGLERIELPVWPELYEKNQELLEENRLVYAILQVEKEERDLRFQAKWLSDLTQVDERLIQECDQAFELLQEKIVKQKRREKLMEKREVQEEKKNPELTLTLDMDAISMSQLISLRDLFHQHGGSSPVKIILQTEEKTHSTLTIDAKTGVTLKQELLTAITTLFPNAHIT